MTLTVKTHYFGPTGSFACGIRGGRVTNVLAEVTCERCRAIAERRPGETMPETQMRRRAEGRQRAEKAD